MRILRAFWLVALVLASDAALAAEAPDIMREWAGIRAPAPPMLVPVRVDPAQTALLMITFDKQVCSAAERVRCPAAVPKVKVLLDAARASGMLVVHGYTAVQMSADMQPELVPIDGEPIVKSAPDKFLSTDLERILKERGITTVILTGTAGNGAVLFTAVGGATLGFDLVVPVDTIPADSAYHEQFALIEMNSIGFLRARTKFTRSDLIAFAGGSPPPAGTGSDVTREWAAITPPPPPVISPVTVDPAKTALLVMDFNKENCTPQARARCPAAIANVKRLMDQARARNMFIVSIITPAMKREDIVDGVAPASGEPVIAVQGDKFYRSELEAMLKARGITTVIATGSSGNGAVLLTTIGGVARGFNVIVPVDTMPADSAYHEQFAIFEIADVMFLRARSTLTRSDMIRF